MRRLLGCAALALIGSVPTETIDLSFHPPEGSVVTKRFEIESRAELLSVTWKGEDFLRYMNRDEIELDASMRVTDEYVRVGERRPLELLRHFDALRTTWDRKNPGGGADPLVFRTVRFRWNGDEDAYDKDWEPPGRDGEVLEGLREDLDCRSLLPPGRVAVGATWTVPPRTLAPVLLPSGAIHRNELLWSSWGLLALEDTLTTRARGWFDGAEVTCKLERVRSVNGRRLARIAVRWSWQGPLELPTSPDGEDGWPASVFRRAVVDVDLELHGRLEWDVEAGHFDSLELDTECDLELGAVLTQGDLEAKAFVQAHWSAEAHEGR